MAKRADPTWISEAVGEILLAPDTRGRSARHFHGTHAIGVCRSGGGTLFALGKAWSYAAGMIVVTNPFDPHWGRPAPCGLDYCLFFPSPAWVRALPTLRGRPAHFWFEPAVFVNQALAERLQQAFERAVEGGGDEPLRAAVNDLFALHAKPASELHARLWGDGEAEAGPELPAPSVAGLAAEAGLSRAHFTRKHRKLVGLSPLDHRRQARVLAARRLIEEGVSLADAASGAGFADQAHMTRQFRQIFGTTPTAFQRFR